MALMKVATEEGQQRGRGVRNHVGSSREAVWANHTGAFWPYNYWRSWCVGLPQKRVIVMEVVRAMVVVVMKHALSKHKQKEINYPIHKETQTMRSKEKKTPRP